MILTCFYSWHIVHVPPRTYLGLSQRDGGTNRESQWSAFFQGPAFCGLISASCGQNFRHTFKIISEITPEIPTCQRVKVSKLTVFIHFGAIFSSTELAISRSFARSALMPPSTISSLWQTQRWEPQEKRVSMRDMGGSNHGYGWLHQILIQYTVTQSLFRAIGYPHYGLIVFEDSQDKVLPPRRLVWLHSSQQFPVSAVKGKPK